MGKTDDPFASSSDEEEETHTTGRSQAHEKRQNSSARSTNTNNLSLSSPIDDQLVMTPTLGPIQKFSLSDLHLIPTEFLPRNFQLIDNNIIIKGASDRVEKDNDFYSSCSCRPRKELCSISSSSSRRRSRGQPSDEQQAQDTTTSTSTLTIDESVIEVATDEYETTSPRSTATFSSGVLTCNGSHCDNVRALTECIDCPTINCQNNRFQHKRFKQLEVRDTKKKGYGIFAREQIKKRDLIMEFVGEVIPATLMKQRISKAEEDGDQHMYFMEIVKGSFLDARYKGGIARFTNHSCDPNACLDKWIVSGRYRLGIFAIRDIDIDEEITFDYHWKPSMKQPTKCYCMSSKCRGYLEVFANDEEKELYIRTGYWVRGSDRLYRGGATNTESLFDEATNQLVPLRLVGKYVKILRSTEGNTNDGGSGMVFDELKVKSYKASSGIFNCFDLQDQQERQEIFSVDPPGVPSNPNTIGTWYWLDQHRTNPVGIKKLEITVDDSVSLFKKEDGTGTSCKEWSTGISASGSSKVSNNIPLAVKTRVAARLTVKFRVAKYLLEQRGIQPMYPDNACLADTFAKHVYDLYKVNSFAVKSSTTDSNSSSNLLNANLREKTTFELVVEGEPETNSEVKSWIRNALDIIKLKDLEDVEASTTRLRSRQALTMSHDWRCLPKIVGGCQIDGEKVILPSGKILSRWHCERLQQLSSTGPSLSPSSSSGQSLLNVSSSSASQTLLLETQSLPTLLLGNPSSAASSSSSSSVGSGSDIDQQIKVYYNLANHTDQQKILNHLHSICKQPSCKLTSSEKLYAFALLMRCLLRFSSTSSNNGVGGSDGAMWNNNKEVAVTLASILVLTTKYSNHFKPKHMPKIIRLCYCQVNNRNEKDLIGMSIEYLYFNFVLEREQEIAIKLNYDLYVPFLENLWLAPAMNPTVVSALTSSATSAMTSSSSSSTNTASVSDAIAGMEKIIGIVNQWNSLYNQAVAILTALSSQSHLLLIPFPWENLQVAMMFIAIGCEVTMEFSATSGTSNSSSNVYYRTPSENEVLFTFPPSHNVNKRANIIYGGMHKLLSDRHLFWNQLTEIAASKLGLSYRELAFLIRYLMKLMMFHLHIVASSHKAFQSLGESAAVGHPGQSLSNQDILDDADLMFHILEFATLTGVFHHYINGSHSMDSATANNSSTGSLASTTCNWSLKTRLNPLFFPVSSVVSFGGNNPGQELLAIDEDFYQGRLGFTAAGQQGLSFWALDETNGNTESHGIPFSMRSIPNSKAARREISKLQQILTTTMPPSASNGPSSNGKATLDNAGVFNSLMFELRLFQQLHYFNRRSSGLKTAAAQQPGSPFFLEPLAFGSLASAAQDQIEIGKLYDLSSSATSSSGVVISLSSSNKKLSIDDSLVKHIMFPNEIVPLSYLLDSSSNLPFSSSASSSSASLSPILAWQWCLDLMLAADHLQYCGIALKWLGEDYLSVSSRGRLMITNLQGAELIEVSTDSLEQLKTQLINFTSSNNSSSKDDSRSHHKSKQKDEKHHERDREKHHEKDRDREKHHEKDRDREKDREKDRDREKDKEKEKKHLKQDKHDKHHSKEKTEKPEKSEKNEDREKEKVHIPTSVLNFTAPEIIFGGDVSHHSTIYVIGMIASWILIGKPLIKNGKVEQKQIDYIYKVLGTPKMVGYRNFDSLPLADVYGKYIQNENGAVSESRSRITKAAKAAYSDELTALFSFDRVQISAGGDNGNNGSIYDPEANDGGGVVDFIVSCIQLVPEKRLTPSAIMKLPFFAQLSSACSRELQGKQISATSMAMSNKARCFTIPTVSRLTLLQNFMMNFKQDSTLKQRQLLWISTLISSGVFDSEEQPLENHPQPPPPPPVPSGPPPLHAAFSSSMMAATASPPPSNGSNGYGRPFNTLASGVAPTPPPPPPGVPPPKTRFDSAVGSKRPLDDKPSESTSRGHSRDRDGDRDRDRNHFSSGIPHRRDDSRDRRDRDREREKERDRSRSRERRRDVYDYDAKKPRPGGDFNHGNRWNN